MIFLFNSWFLLKKEVEASVSIGVDLIDIMKTNTKGFFKATIEGVDKGLAWRILHSVEEQAYGTRGKAAN